jgi:hypothetical protein
MIDSGGRPAATRSLTEWQPGATSDSCGPHPKLKPVGDKSGAGVAKSHNASLSSKMVSAEVASYGAVGSDRRREAKDAFNIRAVVSVFALAGACTCRRLPAGLVGACYLACCSLVRCGCRRALSKAQEAPGVRAPASGGS